MARPRPDPHPLAVHLAGRLSPGTLAAYSRIWRRIERSGKSAAAWLALQYAASARKAEADKTKALSQRTVIVLRAAVERYITEVEKGDLSVLPPKGEVGGFREPGERRHMVAEVLEHWRHAAAQEPEPYRTILSLLPLLGVRIEEICTLQPDLVDPENPQAAPVAITVIGKRNRARRVPLPAKARLLLSAYRRNFPPVTLVAESGDETHRVFGLFNYESGEPRPEPKVCTPRDVGRAMKRLRACHPLLASVVVHQTRHTTATNMLRQGANIKLIQDLLGHRSIRTLERYLHSSEEETLEAMEKL